MSKPKTLVLLTQKFPFESGEEFLAVELKILEQAFDKIIIFPTSVRDFSQSRPTGKNTHVRIVKNPETAKEIGAALISRLFKTLSILFSELNKSGWNYKLLKYYLYHIPYSLKLKSIISKEFTSSQEYVLYSYWMDTNAFAAALLRKGNPEIRLVVKSHGGDLYNDRHASGSIAFRETVYEASESLIFISEHGKSYASAQYPSYASKMKLFRLGVEDLGISPTLKFPDYFQIVSCSSIIPLKRLPLILEVLNSSSLPIRWTHFGGESSAIKELQNSLPKLRDEIEIIWKGRVENDEIQSFYASNYIDLLINLSSNEGIPVSMMEAISFGIPLFANSVGGISEITCEKTGVLIPEGIPIEIQVAQLEDFLLSGKTRDLKFRNEVKQFWAENFSARHNHKLLIQHLFENTFKMSRKFR